MWILLKVATMGGWIESLPSEAEVLPLIPLASAEIDLIITFKGGSIQRSASSFLASAEIDLIVTFKGGKYLAFSFLFFRGGFLESHYVGDSRYY